MSFSHIHNSVHTYIHNQKKCSTSEYFTTKLWKIYDIRTNVSIVVNSRLTWYYPYTKCTYY